MRSTIAGCRRCARCSRPGLRARIPVHDAGPHERPIGRVAQRLVGVVRARGSFGCRCARRDARAGGRLGAGGQPGDEYLCTHEHHAAATSAWRSASRPSLSDELGARRGLAVGGMPPLAELMVRGELRPRPPSPAAAMSGSTRSAFAFAARFAPCAARRGRSRDSHARGRPAARRRVGAVARRPCRQGHRPCSSAARCRPERLSLPAPVLAGAGRHAAPVPGALPPAPRGAAAGRRRPADHRGRARRRLRRPLQLRAQLPPRRRRVAARFRRAARGDRKILQDRLRAPA